MNKNNKYKRARVKTVKVNQKEYKWKEFKEKVGITLKVWYNKELLLEEWYITKPQLSNEYVRKIITRDNL
jgi:hypothetical protein